MCQRPRPNQHALSLNDVSNRLQRLPVARASGSSTQASSEGVSSNGLLYGVSSLSVRTTPTPRLTAQEVVDALYDRTPEHTAAFKSFYSSELGGIVTDPQLMLIHADDRMVHRGSGVFDTAILVEGYVYQLEQHMNRLLSSASKAQIPLPMSVPQLKRTILETTASSKLLNGYIRFWLSAGRAGYGLSPLDCERPAFYCVVYQHSNSKLPVLKGWRVKTSPIPAKEPFFAGLKSVDYLANALAVLDAQQDGYDQGIFVDLEGNVCEGPNMNLAIITNEDELVVPTFDNCLAGITVQRLMELAPQHYESGVLPGVTSVSQRPVTVSEAKQAREVMMVGSSLPVMPVVSWDDVMIGDGTPGESTLALRAMIENDMEAIAPGQHVEVPYGYLTGMVE